MGPTYSMPKRRMNKSINQSILCSHKSHQFFLFRKRKIMMTIINENIFSTSHLKIAKRRTIKTIEKTIKKIRITNAKAKRVKTKKIENFFEKDNAMINAQINNIYEIIFEITIQNSI